MFQSKNSLGIQCYFQFLHSFPTNAPLKHFPSLLTPSVICVENQDNTEQQRNLEVRSANWENDILS